MTLRELPEESALWKEKKALEETEDQSDDPFVPAKEAEVTPDDELLIRVEL